MATTRYIFLLPNAQCESCYGPVRDQVKKCEGLNVRKVTTDPLTHRAYVDVEQGDLTSEQVVTLLTTTINQTTSEASLLKQTPIENKTTVQWLLAFLTSPWVSGLLGLSGGAALLILSLLGVGLPMIAMYAIAGFSTVLTLYLGNQSYEAAVKKLVHSIKFTNKLSMDTLFTVSTLVALGVSLVGLFVLGMPVMFDVALIIFGFRHLGRGIEDTIKKKVDAGLVFRDRVVKQVRREKVPSVQEENAEREYEDNVDIEDLKPGDIIVVRDGQIIPVDGICLEENASILDKLRTGAIVPTLYKKNAQLLAGYRVQSNGNRPVRIQVTASEKDSYLAKLDKSISDANAEEAPLETTANKLLQYFVVTVFALALISFVSVGLFFPPAAAIQCAIAVLVSACPCALGLIVPLNIKIGHAKSIDHGVFFKIK